MIYEVWTQLPDNASALGHIRALPRGFERSKQGEAILEIVKGVKALEDKDLPRMPRSERRPQAHPAVTDLLKVLLKQVSEDEGVASRMIATADEIEQIAGDDKADVPALSGWRRDIYGELALRLKRGEIALAVEGPKLVRVERDVPQKREKAAASR